VGSNAKKKTTFAKISREQKLREKRIEKQMRKESRKLAASRGEPWGTGATPEPDPS
jgi:hypothetical protein